MFGVLPGLNEELRTNVELASPDLFLPPLPGWKDRSPFIARKGVVEFRHYDFCSQALSKIQRGFARDIADAREMVQRGLVDPAELSRLARAIVPDLIRYPAVDPDRFLRAVDAFVAGLEA